MNSKLDKVTDGFVETIGQLGASFGLNRVAAQLYALLFVNNEPLSLDDMVEKLGVSKGNISVNVRELEKWGAARKVWVKGNRKDFYVAELDIFKVITDRLRVGLSRRMEEALGAIKGAEETIQREQSALSDEDKEKIKAVRDRLEKAKEMYWRINSLSSTAFKIMS